MGNPASANEHYKRILLETLNNENLEKNLEEVEEAIAEVDKLIKENQMQGKQTSTLSNIKNELYYLKYQILERN